MYRLTAHRTCTKHRTAFTLFLPDHRPGSPAFGPEDDRRAGEVRGSATHLRSIFTTFYPSSSTEALMISVSGGLLSVTYGIMTVFGPADNQTATNVVAFLSIDKLITTLNDQLSTVRCSFGVFSIFY